MQLRVRGIRIFSAVDFFNVPVVVKIQGCAMTDQPAFFFAELLESDKMSSFLIKKLDIFEM